MVRKVILVGVWDRGRVCGCESYDVGVATKADRVLSSGVVAADGGVLDRALSMTREGSVREVERVVRFDLCCREVCAAAGVVAVDERSSVLVAKRTAKRAKM